MEKVNLVSLIPPQMYRQVVDDEAERLIESFAHFEKNHEERLSDEEVVDRLKDADGCLTSWGVRGFTAEVVAALPRLKIIGHAAGSVKYLIPPEAYDRGIAVVHAAPIIAKSVGEMALGMAIAGRRHYMRHHNSFVRDGSRGDVELRSVGPLATNYGLHHSRIGIIGASATGRAFVKHLKAYGDEIEIWLFDPYVSYQQAEELGTTKVELDELLSKCDIVSLHAPINEHTRGMIGKHEVKKLKDGALLINTARGPLIDYDALFEELKGGRIYAALDVYLETLSNEEIPASKYRELNNVLITPGIAGPSAQVMKTMGLYVARDIKAYFAGEKPKHQVTKEMMDRIA